MRDKPSSSQSLNLNRLCHVYPIGLSYRTARLGWRTAQSIDRVLSFFSSRCLVVLGLPTPSPAGECAPPPPLVPGGGTNSLAGERVGGGGSHFQQGNIHCGTLGIFCGGLVQTPASQGLRFGLRNLSDMNYVEPRDGPWTIHSLYISPSFPDDVKELCTVYKARMKVIIIRAHFRWNLTSFVPWWWHSEDSTPSKFRTFTLTKRITSATEGAKNYKTVYF